MDDVVSILVVVVAVALTAYRNYIKKEKKRNRTSRGRTAGRAPVRVEAEDAESFVKEEHVAHRAVKEKNRRREGAERRTENIRETARKGCTACGSAKYVGQGYPAENTGRGAACLYLFRNF